MGLTYYWIHCFIWDVVLKRCYANQLWNCCNKSTYWFLLILSIIVAIWEDRKENNKGRRGQNNRRNPGSYQVNTESHESKRLRLHHIYAEYIPDWIWKELRKDNYQLEIIEGATGVMCLLRVIQKVQIYIWYGGQFHQMCKTKSIICSNFKATQNSSLHQWGRRRSIAL